MDELKLTSSAFSDGGPIPRECGYENGNISPPLTILAPAGTRSIALIMDDPDAMNVVKNGKKPFTEPYVHWVMYNIDANSWFKSNTRNVQISRGNAMAKPLTMDQWNQAKEDSAMIKANREYLREYNQKRFGESAWAGLIGLTGWGKFDYGGPAPPDKRHTYIFKAYALNIDELPLPRADQPGTKADVEKAMGGPVTKGGHIIEKTQLTGTYAP